MELIENYCIFLWFIINDVIIKINGKNSVLFFENSINNLHINLKHFLYEGDRGKEWDRCFYNMRGKITKVVWVNTG